MTLLSESPEFSERIPMSKLNHVLFLNLDTYRFKFWLKKRKTRFKDKCYKNFQSSLRIQAEKEGRFTNVSPTNWCEKKKKVCFVFRFNKSL